MAALVPAIHVVARNEDADARDKPAHDAWRSRVPAAGDRDSPYLLTRPMR